MKTNLSALALGLVVATLAVAAQAADSPFGIVRRGESPPAAGAKLTFDGLQALLVRMGYQPQVVSAEGEEVLLIQVEHKEGLLKHFVTLDPKNGLVRLNCSFTVEVGAEKVIPAEMYRDLMQDTFRASPSYLRIDGTQVFIATIVSSEGASAERLASLMEHHKQVVDLAVMPVIRKYVEYTPYQRAEVEPAPAPEAPRAPVIPVSPAKKVRKVLSS